MSTILTQGIVLRSYDHREYDRNYTIYTKDAGKISAVVKSAKKVVSKLSSHLEPFFVVNLMIAGGKVIERIGAAQIIKNYSNINQDLSKILMASYFFEVTDMLVKPKYHDEIVFSILENFLKELSNSNSSENNLLILNTHLFNLLRHLGYQPIIKAKKQKGLTREFDRIITEATDRKAKSFELLNKYLNKL